MATQEKNQNHTLMSVEEALLEFDAEIERLESHHQALDDHYNSGKSVMGINFYR